jgi:hypothetical protein
MIKHKSIKKVGQIHSFNAKALNQTNSSFIESFSNDFFSYIAKYSQTQIDFHKDSKKFIDCLYWYGERQLTAAYFHAFHKMGIICISELPIKRKNSKIKSDVNGRVDYWCFYEKIDFYIESKHSNIRYNKQLTLSKYFNNQHYTDIDKLNNSVEYINEDKVSNEEAKLILIHTMSIKMNTKEYEDYKKAKNNVIITQLIKDIKQLDEIEFDQIIGFELNTSITDRVKYTLNDKEYYYPILLMGFKFLNKPKKKPN